MLFFRNYDEYSMENNVEWSLFFPLGFDWFKKCQAINVIEVIFQSVFMQVETLFCIILLQ